MQRDAQSLCGVLALLGLCALVGILAGWHKIGRQFHGERRRHDLAQRAFLQQAKDDQRQHLVDGQFQQRGCFRGCQAALDAAAFDLRDGGQVLAHPSLLVTRLRKPGQQRHGDQQQRSHQRVVDQQPGAAATKQQPQEEPGCAGGAEIEDREGYQQQHSGDGLSKAAAFVPERRQLEQVLVDDVTYGVLGKRDADLFRTGEGGVVEQPDRYSPVVDDSGLVIGRVLPLQFVDADALRQVDGDLQVGRAADELAVEPGGRDLQGGQVLAGQVLIDQVGHGELDVQGARLPAGDAAAAQVNFHTRLDIFRRADVAQGSTIHRCAEVAELVILVGYADVHDVNSRSQVLELDVVHQARRAVGLDKYLKDHTGNGEQVVLRTSCNRHQQQRRKDDRNGGNAKPAFVAICLIQRCGGVHRCSPDRLVVGVCQTGGQCRLWLKPTG